MCDTQAPAIQGTVAIPSFIQGGTTVSFGVSATDNLDLISSDYSLQYGNNPTGNAAATFIIRTPGPTIGTAFDNVLTTSSAFSLPEQLHPYPPAPAGGGR